MSMTNPPIYTSWRNLERGRHLAVAGVFDDIHMTNAEAILSLQLENSKLRQRLIAADDRVDVLEAQLAESRKITLSGCEFSEHELISRAVRAASGTSRRGTQRWVAMKDAFGCGSGVANALCHRFGFDPDEMVKP